MTGEDADYAISMRVAAYLHKRVPAYVCVRACVRECMCACEKYYFMCDTVCVRVRIVIV